MLGIAEFVAGLLDGLLLVFLALAVAVLAAWWLARGRRTLAVRWALVGLGAITLLPLVTMPPFHREQRIPDFIQSGAFRAVLEPDEIVYVIPAAQGDVSIAPSATFGVADLAGKTACVGSGTIYESWLKGEFARVAIPELPKRAVGWATRRRPLPNKPTRATFEVLRSTIARVGDRQPGITTNMSPLTK